MKAIINSIFKTFFVSLCLISQVHLAYAVDQGIVPPAYTTFFDSNGNPLSSGKVYSYVPSTSTPKATYQDFGGTTPNAQPVVLNAAGRAKIWGTGQYRQVVYDKNNNLIWDAVTSAAGSGSSGGGSTATGDGDLVGTIKPWAGMTAPNQYAFTYGQEVSRTTYSALYTAITSTQAVFCTNGSPTLNGVGDTSNFWIGMSLEISCVAAGFTTVVSKTASSVTMAANANVSTNTNATFFPWGRGNGSTTFNLPDLRGVVPMGNNIMGGVASGNVTTTYFGLTDPNSSGALGGSQSKTLTLANIPSTTASGTISNVSTPSSAASGNAGTGTPGGGTGITPSSLTSQSVVSTFTGIPQGGGIAVSAVIAAAGSGYTNGSQTITVSGGTCTTQPQFTVTVSGNVFTGTPSLLTAGSCTVAPTNPASTTGGGGSGGTLTVSYDGTPISLIQPTRSTNFIIKIEPDANSATASGVTALGGMTGSIACGTGLTCTGNIVSIPTSGVSAGSYGSATQVGTFSVNAQGNVTTAANATITGVNGLAVTATSSTLTVASGKTVTLSNTMTQTATDGSTVAFGAGGTVSYLIASGTKALATSAISSATCTSAQTDTATGATTSSVVDFTFASDPTAVTGYTPSTGGMLTIIPYVTSNTVNFKVCNNTLSSITPGAISLNWRVRS